MCSYCGCRNIPLIGRLSQEHEDIANCTYPLHTAMQAGDVAAAVSSAKRLGELMHPHTRLEEHGLFAQSPATKSSGAIRHRGRVWPHLPDSAVRQDELFTEHIDSLCAEHETIDSAVAAVVAGDLSWIQPLLTLLYNHIDREENGLFPAALAFLDNEQWDRLQAPGMLDGAQ